nr:hypothetical protein Iba_chr06fCG9090 [Ipomoea batatas]
MGPVGVGRDNGSTVAVPGADFATSPKGLVGTGFATSPKGLVCDQSVGLVSDQSQGEEENGESRADEEGSEMQLRRRERRSGK